MRQTLKLFILFAVGSILVSCSKQSSEELSEMPVDSPAIYFLNMETMSYEYLPMDQLFKGEKFETIIQERNPNVSANGIANTELGNTIVFSAMQNNGGVHGNSSLGGTEIITNIAFNSDCITASGNQAFFGGLITAYDAEIEGIDVGYQLYTGVEDGGEGNNAGPDRYSRVSWVAEPGQTPADIGFPQFTSWCDFMQALYDYLGDPDFYYFIDGVNPTNVQVNN